MILEYLSIHIAMDIARILPSIVVILARKDGVIKVRRMTIGERMLVGIPPSVTEVKAAHECGLTIDQA